MSLRKLNIIKVVTHNRLDGDCRAVVPSRDFGCKPIVIAAQGVRPDAHSNLPTKPVNLRVIL